MTDLYCFPHSGGFSFQFRPLARALPHAAFRPVDYPRLGDADRRFDEVAGFVDDWLNGLDGTDFGDVCLYGHSLGGLVAFEAAVRLERRGTPAAGVVLAASVPADPTRFGIDPQRCSDEELLEWSYGTVRGTTPSQADREVFAWTAPRLRRDLRAYAAYVPRDGLDRTPVLLLQGTADRVCPPDARSHWNDRISRLTWEEIEGGHLFHLESPERTAAAVSGWKAS